ncbi:geranylgeranylglycerol-phosphate geranylgeranyltransferase [Reichenbachiella agarivorans]|uniref:Geranylgeranylglycerol-phosphate geranylgeranyltransferase n=1 Tax=Reichenbachiella agarivorans TaxID=2979464 RepID=A0ABY6CSZ3_9BACT|nr:geranylgeranylglycerol-phosphate geranylgeranyltransferase [Reichenbachiella agarivorans]UXP33635.1 geranylgeranylglycerol-phosphate geranylgeranyltransferase [Reichenbachiella agarivorans]
MAYRLLVDALRLSRVNNLIIIFFTQYITAIFLLGEPVHFMQVITDFKLFALVLGTVIIAASGYYINDYYDIKIDLINKPDKVIVGRNLKRRPVLLAHLMMSLLGILMGAWVSPWLGLVNLGCAVLLWWYSNQFKRLPFVGNFVVALMTGCTLLVLGIYYHTTDLLLMVYAFFAFGITLIREIIKDIEDKEGDAQYGGLTLPIALGTRRTKYVLYFLMLCFLIFLSYFLYRLGSQKLTVYFLILLLPYLRFVYLLIKADTKIAFTHLSNYCKWLIVAGIFSIIVLNI